MSEKAKSDWERQLINTYLRPLCRNPALFKTTSAMSRDLLDDVAHLPKLDSDKQWVVTMDAAHPGLHYPSNAAPDLAIRRALRRNISDMAASGATPVAWLCALAFSKTQTKPWVGSWLKQCSDCLKDEQEQFGIALVGGDLSFIPNITEGPMITITMIGFTNTPASLQRSYAKPSDICCLSGPVGDASLAWHLYNTSLHKTNQDLHKVFQDSWPNYAAPLPPLALSKNLTKLPRCAAIDISDGLLLDVKRLAHASGLAVTLDFKAIPISSPSKYWLETYRDPSFILTGGDDYALFFTLSADNLVKLTDQSDTVIYPIGTCQMGTHGAVNVTNLSPYTLPEGNGFVHEPYSPEG